MELFSTWLLPNALLLVERKIAVDWAVPSWEKKSNIGVVLKVKEEPDEDSASVKTEKSDRAEESEHIKTEGKCKVLSGEVVKNTETKECKKIRNARKGRLIVRNLPFKVSKKLNQFVCNIGCQGLCIV
jgi:hypothetical protein